MKLNLLFCRFCEHRKLDPMAALCQCDVPLFKVYLVWRVKNSRIKKESTVMTYWKVLSMVYSQKDSRLDALSIPTIDSVAFSLCRLFISFTINEHGQGTP